MVGGNEQDWWYVNEDQRHGPLTRKALLAKLVHGELQPNTLIWHESLGDWQPAQDVSELGMPPPLPPTVDNNIERSVRQVPPRQESFDSVPHSQIGEFLPDEALQASQSGSIPFASVHQDHKVAGPWRRFWARLIDLWLIGILLTESILLCANHFDPGLAEWLITNDAALIFGWFMFAPVMLVEAAVYTLFENTLGKALLGVHVQHLSGKRLSGREYLERQFNVWTEGIFTGVPLLLLAPLFLQYRRLKKGLAASYDVRLNYSVSVTRIGLLRSALAAILILILYLMQAILRFAPVDRDLSWWTGRSNATATRPAGKLSEVTDERRWTNPRTGREFTLPLGWYHVKRTTDYGDAYDLFGYYRGTARVSVIADNDHPADVELSDYADEWVTSNLGQLEMRGQGKTIMRAGRPLYQFDVSINYENEVHDGEATVLRVNDTVWRVLVSFKHGEDPFELGVWHLKDSVLNSIY